MSAALKRSTSTNYYEGYFFITLNTRDYAPILSYISGRPDAPEGAPDAPRCEYTELGRKVMAVWQTVPRFHPQVEIIAAEAMPDHFHGLLRLKAGNRKHLGHLVGGFMGGCTHGYWDILGIDWRKDREERLAKGADALPPDRDRDHTRSFRGPSLFVRGYNDMEAVTPEQVQTKLQYICEQARRALIKGTLRDRFHIHRSCKARGWTLDAIRRGLRAAREGAVIVSAFISPKEREIRRLLLMEQLPVIEVYDNGLADRYKPSGKNFYACAENRLVQISPWNYEYCRNMTVNREVCLVMNELARVIAGTGEGWWKEE